MLDKKLQEKADKFFEEFVSWQSGKYKRYYKVDVTVHRMPMTFDRYKTVTYVGDEVDFIAAAPGGLKRGNIAFIAEIVLPKHIEKRYQYIDNKYIQVDTEVDESTCTHIYVYTKGCRWTHKTSSEIIKIPNTKQ